METAASLYQHGRVAEAVGLSYRALACYTRALGIPECERQDVDAGELLHRVGDSASRSGHASRAWDAYLAAARRLRSREASYLLSGALAGAGLLLADYRPATGIAEFVDEDLVQDGVTNVMRHASDVFVGDEPPTRESVAIVQRKLIGILMLAASASCPLQVRYMGGALSHDVALPFFHRYGIAPLFSSLALLCEALGDQGRRASVDMPPTSDEVRTLAFLAGDAVSDPLRTALLRWLGTYLRDHRGATWASDRVIEAAAKQ